MNPNELNGSKENLATIEMWRQLGLPLEYKAYKNSPWRSYKDNWQCSIFHWAGLYPQTDNEDYWFRIKPNE